MNTKDIVVGCLHRIENVEKYDVEEIEKWEREIEELYPNFKLLGCATHSYSYSEVSEKSYYFKIPFGKFKGKFIDLKNVDTVLSLVRIYFSAFGINEFPIYCAEEDKEKEYEDGMCRVGDIVIDPAYEISYYKKGYGWPNRNIPFRKIKKLIKQGIIEDDIDDDE